MLITGSIVVLILGLLLFTRYRFDNMVSQERDALFDYELLTEVIEERDLDSFPEIMRRYLVKAGVIGKARYSHVVFQQRGAIQKGETGKWISFTANQYMSTGNPGFIWKANAFPMMVRDKYAFGKGEVRISLLGLKNVEVASSYETHQSSLGRYFGELLWFPIGFLDEDISWMAIDNTTVKGTITKDGISFEGYFYFDENGLIETFRGKRYRYKDMENFIGKATDYMQVSGLLIPKKMTAIWDLPEGPMEYFKAEISDYRIIEPTR